MKIERFEFNSRAGGKLQRIKELADTHAVGFLLMSAHKIDIPPGQFLIPEEMPYELICPFPNGVPAK